MNETLQDDLNKIKSKFQSKYFSVFTIEQNTRFVFKEQAAIYRTPDASKVNIDLFIKVHLKEKYGFGIGSKYTMSYSYELISNVKKKMLRSKKKAKKYFWKLEFEYIGD